MVRLIDDLLKADENLKEFNLYISMSCLQFVVSYCSAFDYIKIKSTIFFPALYPDLDQNVCQTEVQIMTPIKNELEQLQQLFVYSKYLRCEALYQLAALSIACWFKSRPNIDEYLEPKVNTQQTQFGKILLEKFPYLLDESQRKNFEL